MNHPSATKRHTPRHLRKRGVIRAAWESLNVKTRDFLASMFFSGPSFLGMLIFYIIPFLVVIYYSFTAGLTDHSFAGLKNYINVWQNGAFRIAVRNTALFTGLSVPLAVVLSLVLALLLEARIPLKSEFRTFFLSPMMVPIASIILSCSTITASSTSFWLCSARTRSTG